MDFDTYELVSNKQLVTKLGIGHSKLMNLHCCDNQVVMDIVSNWFFLWEDTDTVCHIAREKFKQTNAYFVNSND